MKSSQRYPTRIIQSKEENTYCRQFKNLDDIKDSNQSFAETGEIDAKSGIHKTPAKIQARDFKFNIPINSQIKKISVEFTHASSGNIEMEPPTVELLGIDAISKKASEFITDDFNKNVVVFEVNPSIFKVNSPTFGVMLRYPSNKSENTGRIKIQSLKVIVSYSVGRKLKGFFKSKPFIKVKDVNVTNNKILYKFETSPQLDDVFNKKEMFVEYMNIDDVDLGCVPDSILVIPLIANLLPIVWLLDCKLIVDELDEEFYRAIPNIKQGYSYMYKDASFKGELSVKSLKDNKYEIENRYLSLFSYGVDSLSTVIKYLDDKPMLLTIWGSDIPLNQHEGWDVMRNNIDGFARDYDLANFYVRSDFRNFINVHVLYQTLGEYLEPNGNWWHAVQHGIAILSKATILAYLFKVEKILFASTHAYDKQDLLEKNIVQCASSPFIDNEFKFASCSVIHDGCEFDRAGKLDNIINYSKKNNARFNMHVCWFDKSGENCNVCEKCARTYMYLMAIGENPNDYGFDVNDETLLQVERNFKGVVFYKKKIGGWVIHSKTLDFWKANQDKFRQNEHYWNDTCVKWFLDLDIDEFKNNFYDG